MSNINITTFSGTPNDQNFRNYVKPTQLRITSGKPVPLTAIIDEVTFTFQAKIWAGVNDSFWVYDGTNDVPDNNGNYQVDSDACPRITDATTIHVESDTKSTWTFTGVAEDNVRYNDLKALICETNYFTIIVGRKKYKTSGYTGYVYSDLPFSCEVKWHSLEYTPAPPTNIYFSSNSAAPGGNVTLNWSAATLPADAQNKIIGYTIEGYINDSSMNSEIGGSYSPDMPYNSEYQAYFTTDTYFTFPAPTEAGTYYYRVDTVVQGLEGRIGHYTNSTVYTPLTVAVSNIGSPTNLKVNNVTTLYIGIIDIPTLTLSWTAASAGTNNPVANYSIYKIDSDGLTSILGTTTSTSYTITGTQPEGTYYIAANPTITGYSNSLNSNEAQIIKITSKPIITITSSLPRATNSNVTLTWSNAAVASGATTNYNVYKNGTTLLTTTTGTSYTLDITTVSAGSSFTLSIEPYYMTTSGSYTRGDMVTTSQITRAEAFSLPSTFWTDCYDKDAGYNSGVYNYVYSSITLAWNAVISENEAQGSNFIYTIEQQANGGAFSKIAQYDNANSHTISLTNVAEGAILGYRINVTNEFGASVYSDVIQVQKVISPTLNNLVISNVTATSLQSSFEWTRNLAADADDLLCTIILSYGSESYILLEKIIKASDSSPLVIFHENDIALTNTSFATAMSELKTKVITEQTVYPIGTLTVKLSYAHFTKAETSLSNNFKFNYVTAPIMGTISFASLKDFYNPGDVVTVNLSDFTWHDASGGTDGGTVTNYLTSSYSNNKFVFNNNTVSLTAPAASGDLLIILTLETSVTYADVTKKYTTSKTLKLEVARWTSEAVLIDSLTALDENAGLEGYLQLPEQLCSSSSYTNLLRVTPTLIAPSANYTVVFYQSDNLTPSLNGYFTKGEIATNRKIRFVLTNEDGIYSDVTAVFQVTFLNSSDKTLTITTNPYRYFVADIDMAIRKGRVGINVAADFDSHEKDSTLQINAGAQTGTSPIVEILSTNQSTADNKTQFLLLQDGNKASAIWSDGESIFIDNLKTVVEGLTANRVLVSDTNGVLAVSSAITTTELNHLSGVTSNIQTQLNSKQATITGAAATITTDDLTTSCALISNSLGKIAVSNVTSEELSYLSGVTSAIQTQLDDKYTLPTNVTQKYILASPSSAAGVPSFRALVAEDIPNLSASKITSGTLSVALGGTGATIAGAKTDAALNKLGIVYATSTSSISSPYEGMICLVPKG